MKTIILSILVLLVTACGKEQVTSVYALAGDWKVEGTASTVSYEGTPGTVGTSGFACIYTTTKPSPCTGWTWEQLPESQLKEVTSKGTIIYRLDFEGSSRVTVTCLEGSCEKPVLVLSRVN